ncbi:MULTISPECIES: FG-GAP-like repeat-containing protein [unclassified Luteococcus]|uniref:FG-GAP-like repeat-containing protein n=1 Tax=unclassified Luteococcus TaxID=2639923 RepID=UPI00313D09B1
MRTPRRTMAATGLTTAALIGSLFAAAPSPTIAAPTPASAPAAPQADPIPSSKQVDVPAANGTVTVNGAQQRVIAQLGATNATFTMAGVTWGSLKGEVTVQVRARNAAGWQQWQTLDFEQETDARSTQRRQGTSASFFGSSTAVEVRVLTSPLSPGSIGQVKVSLIDSRVQPGDATTSRRQLSAAAQNSTGTPARPKIVSRAGWGANESLLRYNGSNCVNATIDTTIKAGFVHHTEGTNNYTAEQSASILRGIYAFHVKDRGWCDVGYNFLVDKYGTIFEGRHGGVENPVHGAHATNWNTDTVAVSVMMSSTKVAPSSAAMNSVADVLAWKLAGNYRDPLSTLTLAGKRINRISRHGDVMSTDCPGTNITNYMPTLRKQVATKMGDWKSPIYQRWIAEGGEADAGPVHILERPWNGGRTTTFTKGGIFQTPGGSTYWVTRSADALYRASGSFQKLGWPTSKTVMANAGSSTRFQKGTIHVSSAGAQMTTGAIDSWLRSHPTQFATLGYPTAPATSTMSAANNATITQRFQNGTLSVVNGTVTMTLSSMGSGKQGDLNGDGRADVISVARDGSITWFPTQADRTSGAARGGSTIAGAPFTWISQTPDLNGDGYQELIARRTDGTLWSWEGRGNGKYTAMRQVGHGWATVRQINVVPDMDGDKLPEIVAISADQRLMRYSLGRDLKVIRTLQIGKNWGKVVHMTSLGDYRSAGVTDILGVTQDGKLLDYFGSRSGVLVGYRQVGQNWHGFTQMYSIGDLNGDGRWDLMGNRATGPLYNYLNLKGTWSGYVPMLPEVSALGLVR